MSPLINEKQPNQKLDSFSNQKQISCSFFRLETDFGFSSQISASQFLIKIKPNLEKAERKYERKSFR